MHPAVYAAGPHTAAASEPRNLWGMSCHVAIASVPTDDATLARLTAGLPAWRRDACAKLVRPPDRASCVAAFALLTRLWEAVRGGVLPPSRRASSGAIEVDGAHVSVSHQGGWVAAALATDAVGVDVHTRVPFDADLFDDLASARERHLADRLAADDDLAWLWTRKEALGKRSGRGLVGDLRGLDAWDNDLHTWSSEHPRWMLSVACERRPTLRRLTWEEPCPA